MFLYERKVSIDNEIITFKYKIITSELSCMQGDKIIFRQFLWLPYKTFNINIHGKDYRLKTLLLPINKCSLYYGEEPICQDLFPKLKRYTLISFCLSTIKKVAIMITLALS